ncbi:BlaI/MecI/CopY family transcriptional regulator [Brevibacillus ruminantium]|uniref:BlaI/MecI/CopY family transcriptional regulator n=1 Tax=Brevibacillus ruminantium TaxID=2950604 RepID=A0ABY4WJP2_9BACL|nr:BlaI/MecI/CopY family transcriptional regulator [Brevibacillus ruminantium]USG67356.1 BlaI/MecI/CopY family transcriptional regulator [Brevibacillus ruminantium]
MKKFIANIVYDGARMVETEFKQCSDGRTVIASSSIVPNLEKYLTVPESVKRCYYLDANEKLVLFELYSWAKDDGKCQVAMDLVSLKLGISERTVRTCVKELVKKKFVQVSKQGRSNIYTFDALKDNPYLVLSEFVHEFIQNYYYKAGLLQDKEWVKAVGDEGVRLWREAVVDTLAKEAKKEEFYKPYLLRLTDTPDDYENIAISFTNELLELINNDVMKKASKLGLLSEAV